MRSLLMFLYFLYIFLLFLPTSSWSIIIFTSNHQISNEVWVRQLCGVNGDKELCKPFFNNFFEVLFSDIVVVVKFFFSFIGARSNINKMPICMRFHKRPEPVQVVWCHTREGLNIPPKMKVIGMKYCVWLPLLSHIAQIPEHGELRSKQLEWIDVREGHTFRHSQVVNAMRIKSQLKWNSYP